MHESTAQKKSDAPPPNRQAIEQFDDLPPFVPHRFWRGGWLQTVSIKAMRPELTFDNFDGATVLNVHDDQTPPDEMSGYHFPAQDADAARPLVIVFHGMGGDALSGYMRSMAHQLIRHGYSVLLWNNRGAGRSAKTCHRLHHPGYTDDVVLLCDHVRNHHRDWIQNGATAVAFSLGANLMLKYMAETGDECFFDSAVSVSAPLDMEITSKNLRRGWNRIFDRYLLRKQREELLRPKANLSPDEREVLRNVKSVWELDDKFTAPRIGYQGAKDFYRQNSAIHSLHQITKPTLMIHAKDDPVVDADVFTTWDWQSGGPLYPALATSGGHTGFFNRDGTRWHEAAAITFLDRFAK